MCVFVFILIAARSKGGHRGELSEVSNVLLFCLPWRIDYRKIRLTLIEIIQARVALGRLCWWERAKSGVLPTWHRSSGRNKTRTVVFRWLFSLTLACVSRQVQGVPCVARPWVLILISTPPPYQPKKEPWASQDRPHKNRKERTRLINLHFTVAEAYLALQLNSNVTTSFNFFFLQAGNLNAY